MKINRRWAIHAFFTLLEHGATRGLDAVATLVLIRTLSAPDFGLFSVYQSWVSVLLLCLPAIELGLFREYGTLKREGRLASELGIYRSFNFLKIGVAAALAALLAFIPQDAPWSIRAALLALAFGLPLSHAVYSFMREPLRFEMRQHLVAILSAAQRALFILALIAASAFWPGESRALVALALSTYVIFGFAWARAARDLFAGGGQIAADGFWPRVRETFLKTVLWIHLNGVISQSIQTFDIFSLNLWRTDLAEIGRYGIALKAANFFQIAPLALISSFGVYLAKHRGELDPARERKLVALYSCGFVALCAALLLLGFAIGEPLLHFLAKGKLTHDGIVQTIQYFRWQLAGTMLYCASFPLTTYLGLHARLPSMFFRVNLPWAVISAALYIYSANRGPLAAARANVAVYACGSALFIAFFLTSGLQAKPPRTQT